MATTPTRPRVKICGIRSPPEALLAAELGADLIGLNFHPESPRRIDIATAKEIADAILGFRVNHPLPPLLGSSAEVTATGLLPLPRPSSLSHLPPPLLTGVFVHQPVQEANAIGVEVGLDLLQLHGDYTPEEVAPVAGHAVVALRLAGPPTADDLAPWRQIGVWGILLDARHPELFGGSGRVWDYALAAGLRQPRERLLIAGGLDAGNVVAAIEAARPWGVDLCSGVESAPGERDPRRLRELFAALQRQYPST